MKRMINIIMVTALILVLSACGVNYKIITKILPDGSCERTMIATGDSAHVNDKLFVIDIDSSWTRDLKWSYDTSENKKIFILTVKKHYPNVSEMNREFYKDTAVTDRPLTSQKLVKKFRWFYTRYEYKETYHQQFPFKYFPISNYLTPREIDFEINDESDSVFFAGKDSAEIKKIKDEVDNKMGKFLADNMFEGFYQRLLIVGHKGKTDLLEKYDLLKKKEELRRIVFYGNDSSQFLFDKEFDARSILSTFDSVFNTKDFTNILKEDPTAFKSYNDKQSNAFANLDESDYVHSVSMPGKLVSTNATGFEDNIPEWKVAPDNYFFSDYIMKADSRRTNTWAFVVTGIILLLSLLSLFTGKRVR